jgi:SH3-like domain-containing protein
MNRRRKLTNNTNDWDCGVQAIENLKRIARTKKRILPHKAGIIKHEGVLEPIKYAKALKGIPKVKKVKVQRKPKVDAIVEWLEKDTPVGKTQNVAIVHSKIEDEEDSHYWLAYKLNKGKKSLIAANFDDLAPIKKVSLHRLKKKDIKIKRVYKVKIEK